MSTTEVRKKKVALVTTLIGIVRELKVANPTPESLEAARQVEEDLQESISREPAPTGG